MTIVGRQNDSNHTALAQLLLDLVMKRMTEPDVANFLNFSAHSEFAARPCDESRHTIHCERKQGSYSKNTQPKSKTTPRTGMHEIADKQTSRRPENDWCRHSAAFHPSRCCLRMHIWHARLLYDFTLHDNYRKRFQ
jgi:hypothetical protein